MTERVALVTGASSGLGRVMAQGLLRAGHRVVLSGTDRPALEDTLRTSRAGDRGAIVPADLADEAQVSRLAREAEQTFGKVDVLVNNAAVTGGAAPRPYEAPLRDVRRVFEINMFAPIELTQRLVPGMIRRGWGRLVFISTSLDTMLRFVPYGMTKAAGEAFIAALATSLESTGVTANALLPGGMTATRMTAGRADPATLLQPEIMVEPIIWLTSDASNSVTGKRFIAAKWNSAIANEQAAQAAGAPVAWSGYGDRAISPSSVHGSDRVSR